MNLQIRQETPNDYQAVAKVIALAFKQIPYSDQTEHLLVARLRQSEAFVPELSLVAVRNEEVVGHILLTKIQIKNAATSTPSLALAPVSVHPSCQNKGMGQQLILRAHEVAKGLGFQSIVLVGHETYYPRFGYQQAHKFGVRVPFDAPKPNVMLVELVPNALQGKAGTVEYNRCFFE